MSHSCGMRNLTKVRWNQLFYDCFGCRLPRFCGSIFPPDGVSAVTFGEALYETFRMWYLFSIFTVETIQFQSNFNNSKVIIIHGIFEIWNLFVMFNGNSMFITHLLDKIGYLSKLMFQSLPILIFLMVVVRGSALTSTGFINPPPPSKKRSDGRYCKSCK